MALFRRRRVPEKYRGKAFPREGEVERFWAWWESARAEVTAAVEDGDAFRLRALLDSPVQRIHPDLSWHAGLGVTSSFMLVVSGAHHPALRVVTERWRCAGPADGPAWEFHAAMPAEPAAFTALVQVTGVELEPAEGAAMVRLDDRRFRMDVTIFHPAFDRLDQGARDRVANVLVGWALGEDDTDRWVSQITATTTRPIDTVPVSMLSALGAQLADRWGGERWAVLEGTFGRTRLIAAVRHPLHRVDRPLFDEHIAVRLPYQTTRPDGLPAEDAGAELEAAQREIVDRLGTDAVLVATQTAGGERLLHFYADSESSPVDAIRAVLAHFTASTGPGAAKQATVQASYDPGWDAVEHLRVISPS